jgi:hypothetical protein
MQVVADTFQQEQVERQKHRAMQLIEEYEKQIVIFWGGAIGLWF